MPKFLILFILFFALIFQTNAQIVQEDFSEDEAFAYKAELTAGVLFHTLGGIPGGIRVKYAWQREKKIKQFNNISLEIVNIKHPKEVRLAADSGNGYFIYDKVNFLFVIRPNYSREYLLFRKSSEEGLELKLITSVGPSIGLIKPYYIIVSNGHGKTSTVQYSSDVPYQRILGSSFFSGFDAMSATMGLNARVSLEFGISTWDTYVTGVELGFMVEAFTKKIVIIENAKNRSAFSSAFINIYFGKRY